ncbi:hypothetical protein [Rhizobium sp.]
MFWKKRATQGGRLTLHIGIHRTGTTGLQRALAANRDRLKAQGKCYPFDGTNHQDIAWALHRGKMNGQQLVKKLAPYAADGHLILSGEDFCIHRDLSWLAPLKDVYNVEVIVYLRRQDHWVMSWYNQHVKWPFSRRHSVMTPKEFLGCIDEFYWLDFDAMLSRWADALGHDKIRVRVIEKGQVTDAITDFLSLVNLDKSRLEMAQALQNDSLPTEMLEYVRPTGMFDIKNPERVAIIEFLQAVAKSAGYNARTVYTAAERQEILARFASSNAAAGKTWFGTDNLFQEGPPDDGGLYVEGTLAAVGKYDDLMRHALRALGRHQD